jgi:oligopeptide/dipeptide ABC transporter ATP-binding protein
MLSVDDVVVTFRTDRGSITPVDRVSLRIGTGETLGLVGESGCGKSTLGRAILQLVPQQGGEVRLDGQRLNGRTTKSLRPLRRQLQVIFQDPRGSLDPQMRIADIVAEPLVVHKMETDREVIRRRVDAMLVNVGLDPALGDRRPGQLSGGQQQRVGIARALITEPRLVVCDEPVSALDVSVQAQVIDLLQELKARTGVGYLFISHNLAVVRHLSDRVAVMYLGRIVEEGPAHEVFRRPLHPYTRSLLASVLRADTEAPERLHEMKAHVRGDVPNLAAVPAGCRFHPRCPFATEACRSDDQSLQQVDGEHAREHRVACHRWREIEPMPEVYRAR